MLNIKYRRNTYCVGFLMLNLLVAGCRLESPKIVYDGVEVVSLNSDRSLLNWPHLQTDDAASRAIILLAKLKSTSDLVELSKEKEIHVIFNVHTCDSNAAKKQQIFAPGYLHVAGKTLGATPYFDKANLKDLKQKDGQIRYDAAIPILGGSITGDRLPKINSDAKPAVLYNPRDEKDDLCLQLSGSKMWTGGGFELEPIVIKRQDVLNAIQDYEKRSLKP
jgi:hypothetical protein